jgi:hypothetical protein
VIDAIAIKVRFEALSPRLNERARRLFVASEARAAGRGGVTAVSNATSVARSTINRGLVELRNAEPQHAGIRRPGGGRKPKIETEPGLLEALATLVHFTGQSRPHFSRPATVFEESTTSKTRPTGTAEVRRQLVNWCTAGVRLRD